MFGYIPHLPSEAGGGGLLPQSEYYLSQYLPVHGGWRKKALLVFIYVIQKAAEIHTPYRTQRSQVVLEDALSIWAMRARKMNSL